MRARAIPRAPRPARQCHATPVISAKTGVKPATCSPSCRSVVAREGPQGVQARETTRVRRPYPQNASKFSELGSKLPTRGPPTRAINAGAPGARVRARRIPARNGPTRETRAKSLSWELSCVPDGSRRARKPACLGARARVVLPRATAQPAKAQQNRTVGMPSCRLGGHRRAR
jgi:hypothetical protein